MYSINIPVTAINVLHFKCGCDVLFECDLCLLKRERVINKLIRN